MNFSDVYKSIIIEALEDNTPGEVLKAKRHTDVDGVELVRATEALLKEKKIDSKQAIKIAQYFLNDKNPEVDDQYDKEVKRGEDPRIIFTVRASLCWLLQSILAQFDANDYPVVFKIIEKLADSDSEKNTYVRRNATVPLSLITHNLNAKKRSSDEQPFEISQEIKDKTVALAFRMLKQNQEYPRVLEYLVAVFDPLRLMNEEDAMHVLKMFFYKNGGTELHPDYLVTDVAPLAIFFAEFRKKYDKTFKNEAFQNFLFELINKAGINVPSLKGTLIWLFWKEIEKSPIDYPVLKKYIPKFFEGNYQSQVAGQLQFLIEKILVVDPKYGVELFNKLLTYVATGSDNYKPENRLWLMSSQMIVEQIAEISPNELIPILIKLERLWYQGVYIGEIDKLFSSYKNAPQEKQDELKKMSLEIYKRLREKNSGLPIDI